MEGSGTADVDVALKEAIKTSPADTVDIWNINRDLVA